MEGRASIGSTIRAGLLDLLKYERKVSVDGERVKEVGSQARKERMRKQTHPTFHA